jgi:DNA adenine methylase
MKMASLVAKKKLRSPLKWHGGKSYLARRIIALFPPHVAYLEPYFGGGSILLNKRRAEVETVRDINPPLSLFWSVLGDEERFGRFFNRITTTKYEASAFALAKRYVEDPPWPLDEIDRAEYAAMFLRWNRMSRGGLGKDFAWSDRLRGKTQPGGPIPGDANAWRTLPGELLRAHERTRGVTVISPGPALELIQAYRGRSESLIYCDPPYLHETRTAKKAYAHEMTRDAHAELLEVLMGCEGKVALSGYRSTLYDKALQGWRRVEFDMPNHSGQGKAKQRRTECVWLNY